MKKTTLGLSLILMTVAVWPASYRAKRIIGNVRFKRLNSDQYHRLNSRISLKTGDQIITAKKSSCQLQMDSVLIQVKPNSKMTITENNDGSQKKKKGGIIGFFGRFLVKARKKKKTHFSFYSPTCVAGVRGTEFEANIGLSGKTRINMKEGEVAVGKETKTMALRQGQESTVGFDKSPLQSSPSQKKFDYKQFEKSSRAELKSRANMIIPRILDAVNRTAREIELIEQRQDRMGKEEKSFRQKALNAKKTDMKRAKKLMRQSQQLRDERFILAKEIKHKVLRLRSVVDVAARTASASSLNPQGNKQYQTIKTRQKSLEKKAFPNRSLKKKNAQKTSPKQEKKKGCFGLF